MKQKPPIEFCLDMGCGALDEDDKYKAVECTYTEETYTNWRDKYEREVDKDTNV